MEQGSSPRMHVSLYVKSIEHTVNFYSKFFNQEPAKVKEDYAKFVLDQPSLIISFVEKPERVRASFGHLGFQVATKEELQSRLDLVNSNQMNIKEEMGVNCCYAEQDKFWVADPDGHQWEVYYFHADSEFTDPNYQRQLVPPTMEEKPSFGQANCEPGSGCC